MNSIIQLHRVYLAAVLLLCMAGTAPVRAVEVFDNTKLVPLLEAGTSLDVIMKLMSSSECHFDGSGASILEIQTAAKKGGMKPDELSKLQIKVIEIAGLDKKRLKTLVDQFLNTALNDEARGKEYASSLRSLMKEGRAVVPYLLASIEQESDRERGGVLDALGHIGDKSPEVVRTVSLMLATDRSKPVRLQAAMAIAALAGPGSCEELMTKLSSQNEMQDGLAMALGYLHDARATEPLTRLLKYGVDPDARVCAAFALGEIRAKTQEATDALLEAVLDDHDEKLRESATSALCKIGDKRTVQFVTKSFERFRQGHEQLLQYLAYFKDLAGARFLANLVTNADDPKVKKAAIETLVVMTGGERVEPDEWSGYVENFLSVRPDWYNSAAARSKIPDAPGGHSSIQPRSTEDSIPASVPR